MGSVVKEFDLQKSEQFADGLVSTLNNGAVCLLISIGHRIGLFDTLDHLTVPSTSSQIARAAKLNERYVREWLGGMVTAGYVVYNPAIESYWLPKEHSCWLTRAAIPDNMAVFSQYIPLLGSVEDQVLECFKDGGGVPYSSFVRFHDVMAEESEQSVIGALKEHILLLILGLETALDKGIDVMDLGCGRGRALIQMASWYPNSVFVGYDFSEDVIADAKRVALEKGLHNIRFEVKDASLLDEKERYDLICTFDAIHDQANPGKVLANIRTALRAKGTYLMQDIFSHSHLEENMQHPLGPMLYTISVMHCMTVSLAQGGEGLGTMWGVEKATEMLKEAGFSKVEQKRLAHDIQNAYFIVTK